MSYEQHAKIINIILRSLDDVERGRTEIFEAVYRRTDSETGERRIIEIKISGKDEDEKED